MTIVTSRWTSPFLTLLSESGENDVVTIVL